MGEGGLMSLKTEGASLEAQRGRPGPGAAAVSPPRPPGLSPVSGRRSVAVAGCQPQNVLFGFEREKRGRERPVPKTQKAVAQEALCKAVGAVHQGPHTAEAPGPSRGGEQVSEVVCVCPPRAAGAAPPGLTSPVLPPSDYQGRF